MDEHLPSFRILIRSISAKYMNYTDVIVLSLVFTFVIQYLLIATSASVNFVCFFTHRLKVKERSPLAHVLLVESPKVNMVLIYSLMDLIS